jgi:hypothetical protein
MEGAINVRSGSDSEVELADADFRFTPESGHPVGGLGCPKSANRRHIHRLVPQLHTSCGVLVPRQVLTISSLHPF